MIVGGKVVYLSKVIKCGETWVSAFVFLGVSKS